jgi:hypothetical protein
MSKWAHGLFQLMIGAANMSLVGHYTQGNPWPAALAAGGTYLVGALLALSQHGNGN